MKYDTRSLLEAHPGALKGKFFAVDGLRGQVRRVSPDGSQLLCFFWCPDAKTLHREIPATVQCSDITSDWAFFDRRDQTLRYRGGDSQREGIKQ